MAPYVAGGPAGGSAPATVPDPVAADPVEAELARVLGWLGTLRAGEGADDTTSDRERIDRIAMLERLKAAAGAAQSGEMVAFGVSQVAAQEQAKLDPRKLGRGIADQLGLACHVSPTEGSRRLNLARALHFDLPHTYGLLRSGKISEYTASLVASETRHLDAQARREVDRRLAAVGLEKLPPRRAAAEARRLAYAADPEGYVHRGRTERKHRRVGLRPAPDTMAVLSGYLPVEQGVACLAALRRYADGLVGAGDGRSKDQIMADAMVERLTGQATAPDLDVEVGLLMPLGSLLDPDDPTPADLVGYGPLPAQFARDLLATSQGRCWWRRLFTAPASGAATVTDPTGPHPTRPDPTGPHPTDTDPTGSGGEPGPVVGGDPQRRRFDGWLAQFLRLRDRTCRDPYCDAPIRHLDHIVPYRDGGPTTAANGRGLCERGNYVREMPGWQVRVLHDGRHGQPHTIEVTTPTGHTYTSSAPQPP